MGVVDGILGWIIRVITGIEPVFDFMGDIWGAFPFALQVVITLFFAVAVGFIIIRNFIL